MSDKHYGISKRAGAREKEYPKGTEIRNNRQFSAVSLEELQEIGSSLDIVPLDPELLGANLLLSGCPQLTKTPPLSRLVFPSGAVLVVFAENLPCTHPGVAIDEKFGTPGTNETLFPKAAIGKRGIVGWVERAGVIVPGDHFEIVLPKYGN